MPLASDSPWSPALGPSHLSWLFLEEPPEDWPRVTAPDVWIVYRTNPAISFWDTTAVANIWRGFRSMVAFAYTVDETNHFADLLLPDSTDSRACS